MIGLLRRILRREQPKSPVSQRTRRIVIGASCLDEAARTIRETAKRGHEGMVYFGGVVGRDTTLAVICISTRTATTTGSVDVDRSDMANVVRTAVRNGLQVVGQLHTHPGSAYHSDGDLRGMRIRHEGYFSLVAPRYGVDLPSLAETDLLMWDGADFGITSGIQVLEDR